MKSENAYPVCLAHALVQAGLEVEQEMAFPVHCRGHTLDVGYRIDMWVNKKVIVEIKAVGMLMPVHSAQLLSYLKLGKCRPGFLPNFNVEHMKDGIKRVVNGL